MIALAVRGAARTAPRVAKEPSTPGGHGKACDDLRQANGEPTPDAPARAARLWAWAELLRISALFTVPGDALAGAAATGTRPHRGTFLAVGTSLCLYHAGMALNDYADRDEDAVDRPHRPIPSGRITPTAALTAAGALTLAGLALARRAGPAPLVAATALAATVWSYDLGLKHTPAGPAAMASARALDLLLGATATRPRALATALPHAGLLGAHTYAVTSVSRHETQGGSTAAPLAAVAVTAGIATITGGGAAALRSLRASRRSRPDAALPASALRHSPARALGRGRAAPPPRPARPATGQPAIPLRAVAALAAASYAGTALTPLLHAALNPSPQLTQRGVGAGIRAMIPLQAALAARAGAGTTALAVLALGPLARRLARKVSPT
ncbi:SCO3242 family prenyltransferase [Streptomyces sp. NPDC058691]|uniref:SCO3242 family prenyltransferase n=1 Tax=Streptomyces sp. NPDC058691 TaxID=3346601 RepID=UPI0036567D26